MKPIHAVKGLVPVNITGLCKSYRGIGTVIDHLAGKLVRAVFEEVYAHATLAANYLLRIYTETAKLTYAVSTHIVFR